jgi:hypothetical protein
LEAAFNLPPRGVLIPRASTHRYLMQRLRACIHQHGAIMEQQDLLDLLQPLFD